MTEDNEKVNWPFLVLLAMFLLSHLLWMIAYRQAKIGPYVKVGERMVEPSGEFDVGIYDRQGNLLCHTGVQHVGK